MKHFVGIDLGTTNSAICSYDGENIRIWKSPDQNDVTPSAIYIDKRSKYIGRRAYDLSASNSENAALCFKRHMGTNTTIKFASAKVEMRPEECSAEILKILFGYLPEEVRNDPDTGTVITVPAAFNQMQKDATMQAAEMAKIGKVALMQEPVAAVMSVVRAHKSDGTFLIFDLGGGTLDIAIAECISGRVNLLAHGGIAMCGGRDFDRAIVDNIIRPWLTKTFKLPDNFVTDPTYKNLVKLAPLAAERAKIELSSREETNISMPENEIRLKDLEDEEIYLDIPITREQFNPLIDDRINEAIEAARETLTRAGLSAQDIQRIVFIGGPTNYKPLRDKIVFEMGIQGSTEVNPMTAVAEGAGLFAESIDWSSQSHSRKNTRGQVNSDADLGLTFNYIARTPDNKAKIVAQLANKSISGYEFQIDSLDTGWSSGRVKLETGAALTLSLQKSGNNTFKVFVFDNAGSPIKLPSDKIIITRTAATVDAIPASHSIGIEVREKGASVLDYLVRAGDPLPKKGKKIYKAGETLKAGSSNTLNFMLWEGEIENPVQDNLHIGAMKISGQDFVDGIIPKGADLECEYEMMDSGNIKLTVSVPCIGATFNSGKNFYSRQDGQIDYAQDITRIRTDGEETGTRLEEMAKRVSDPKLDQAREKLSAAQNLDPNDTDPEKNKFAMEQILEAKKLMAKVRKEHQKEIWQMDLDNCTKFFDDVIREHAKPSEENSFDNLAKTAQRSIDRGDINFEAQLKELKDKNTDILCKQDWFIIGHFKYLIESPHNFSDKAKFSQLVEIGKDAIAKDDINKLRAVIGELYSISIGSASEVDILTVANIVRG